MEKMLADLTEHSNGEWYYDVRISQSAKVYISLGMENFFIEIENFELALFGATGDIAIKLESSTGLFPAINYSEALKKAESEVATYIKNN